MVRGPGPSITDQGHLKFYLPGFWTFDLLKETLLKTSFSSVEPLKLEMAIPFTLRIKCKPLLCFGVHLYTKTDVNENYEYNCILFILYPLTRNLVTYEDYGIY